MSSVCKLKAWITVAMLAGIWTDQSENNEDTSHIKDDKAAFIMELLRNFKFVKTEPLYSLFSRSAGRTPRSCRRSESDQSRKEKGQMASF